MDKEIQEAFDREYNDPAWKRDKLRHLSLAYLNFKIGYKSRDEEIKKLREIIECKNVLLIAYRLGTNKGVGKALDRLRVLKDGE